MRRYENISIDKLKPYKRNARTHSDEQIEKISQSIKEFGFINPVLIDAEFGIIAGHGRVLAAKNMGVKEVPCLFVEDLTDAQKRAYILADNKIALDAGWDDDILKLELINLKDLDFDISLTGFEFDEYTDNNEDDEYIDESIKGSLTDKYLIAPFSVFNADSPRWFERKRFLTSYFGIESNKGRDHVVTYSSSLDKYRNVAKEKDIKHVSIFDPVLCETSYNWFCKKNGKILDPFAGGSVRGIMAGAYGFDYFGVDLSETQINENKIQFENLKQKGIESKTPNWIVGDSANIDKLIVGEKFDLMFSCPPYADLEVYSDDPKDISNMDYNKFLEAYCTIIKKCYNMLDDDTFAVWVIGELRDKKSKDGRYINFIGDTIKAFVDAGFIYYNEIIYVTPNGSLPFRIGRQFEHGRKIGKKHQNILMFCKGDPIKATEKLDTAEFLKDEYEEDYNDDTYDEEYED